MILNFKKKLQFLGGCVLFRFFHNNLTILVFPGFPGLLILFYKTMDLTLINRVSVWSPFESHLSGSFENLRTRPIQFRPEKDCPQMGSSTSKFSDCVIKMAMCKIANVN